MATDASELRRYLLGELADEATAAIEQEYFARAELFDRIWDAEHELIDDYLAGRLSPADRSAFEQHYLSTPDHRARVAVARQLRSAAASGVPPRTSAAVEPQASWRDALRSFRRYPIAWRAAAAATVVAFIVVAAILRPRPAPETMATTAPPREQPSGSPPNPSVEAPRAAPVVVAVSIPPFSVRGSGDPATLTVAPGTGLVVVRLESEPNAPPVGRGRVVVRTVAGAEVWRGSTTDAARGSGVAAQFQVPAKALPPDDYIVQLLDTAASGRETETNRYFLRVRAQ